MKQIKTKSILMFSLVLVLIWSACGQPTPVEVVAPPAEAPAPAATPAADAAPGAATQEEERVTLTYLADNLGAAIITTFNDNIMYQEIMNVLGIDIEFIHVAAGQGAEQIGVMIASRDLPDIMEITLGGYVYPRGWRALVDDGFAMRLNEIAPVHMPDFYAFINSDMDILRSTILDCGTIWSVPCLHIQLERPWRGKAIRYDWLQQIGRNVPQSLGELEEVLIAFQQELGVAHPMPYLPMHGVNHAPVHADGPIVSGFGIGPRWFIADGEYRFGPMQDEFRDYLEMLNRWYQLGLIDPDSPALDGGMIEAGMVTGEYGLSMGFFGGYGPLLRANIGGQELDPDFFLQPFPNLPVNPGDTVQFRNFDFINKGSNAIISATSDHIYEAARFLNFGFTSEGFYLYNYGVEGISWERGPDGAPVWTDRIIHSELGSWVNIREHYKRHQGPYLRDYMAFPITEFEELCMIYWGRAGTALTPVMLVHTTEEQPRFTAIWSDATTVLTEHLWRFITGDEPLDNFDEFRARLVEIGIQEAIDIQNAAYQRYLARSLN